MNRSIRGVHFALGIPLVLALAVSPASADEQRGMRQPSVSRVKPPKSRAQIQRQPRGPAAAQPPARPPQAPPPAEPAQPTEPPREIERQREQPPQQMPPQQMPPEQMRPPQQPPEQGMQPPVQPPPRAQPPELPPPEEGLEPESSCVYSGMEPAGINERDFCSMVVGKAHVQYEEIPGGAALVLTPKPGYTLADLRRSIDDLEYAVEKGKDLPVPAVQQRCYMFDLYRRTGTLPTVMEGRNMMRLHFKASKSSEVMPLRTEAYQFACTPPL